MDDYKHEDAFKDANLYAGRKVNLPEALKVVKDKDSARLILEGLQTQYLNLFEAFIAGVDYGRSNPK